MTRPTALAFDDVQQSLKDLHPDWAIVDDKLRRVVKLASFAEAFGLMAEIAIHAEKLDHHPEWFNVYNRVEIDLTTHDAGGISTLDIELATRIDEAATKRSQ